MRELKFRVWSEEDKEYRTDLNVFRLHDGKIICTSPAYSLEGYRFDVEQYTELKDKNDKEIYEGDIVSIYKGSKNFAVEQNRGRWEIGLDSLYLWQDFCEIIGNVHENPELLEEEE